MEYIPEMSSNSGVESMFPRCCFLLIICITHALFAQDPLPSWNEGATKQAILEFVRATCDPLSPQYVPASDRIVTFDQDGTLWVEHPLYTQGIFALERIKELAPLHPEWKNKEPFKAIINNDYETISKFQEHDWASIVAVTLTGMSTEDFLKIVTEWLAIAKHPRFNQPYTKLVYQPMLELMEYLRANAFKTYIVTGGGQEFVRAYSQPVYNIPPEQVIGSSVVTQYEYQQDSNPLLMRLPQLFLMTNFGGKAIGINLFIGKKPYAAFGNSTGDQQMLEWTQAGLGKRLMMLVLHDDAQREYAYGPAGGLPNTDIGTFSDSLMTEAKNRKWVVISMKNDWKRIFSFDRVP